MKVTREVIYDLLPSYFAGDASDDTRALVEAYFETDPEFGRMAARFHAMVADRQQSRSDAGLDAEATARERETFACARKAAELPTQARAAAVGFGLASLFSFGVAMITWNERMAWRNPGILLGVIFGLVAVVTFAASFRVNLHSWWWREMSGLDDETLRSAGLGARRSRRRA
jgi:anti-sigma factor RsiW